jgi:hypothetical protein
VQSAVGDVFSVQDDFTRRIIELAIPLTGHEERMLKRDVPATARAYEFYLRGNRSATRAPSGRWPAILRAVSHGGSTVCAGVPR